MGFLDYIGLGTDKVISSVGEVIDNLVTSDEERELIKVELLKIKAEANKLEVQKEIELEKRISERWTSDNEHPITRLVRPAIVAWIIGLLTVLAIFDGNIGSFEIREAYIPLIEGLAQVVIFAYFTSRGFEKITKTVKGSE